MPNSTKILDVIALGIVASVGALFVHFSVTKKRLRKARPLGNAQKLCCYLKAFKPVISKPVINKCISWVPS